MATKVWLPTSGTGHDGTGDWYENTTSWLNATSHTFGPSPVAGDEADIYSGQVTITAADVTAHGTLDGISIFFPAYIVGGSTAVAGTLDVTDESFGSGVQISDHFSGGRGELIARGTVGFAGTLSAAAGGFTVDLELADGVGTFTNTGLIETSNITTLTLTGTTSAVLVDSGTLAAHFGAITGSVSLLDNGSVLADNGGTLTWSNAVTIANTASLGTGVSGNVLLTGRVTNAGSIYSSFLSGSLASAGKVTITGLLTNTGQMSSGPFGSLDATGGVINNGTITEAAGEMTLGGGVTNNGAIIETTPGSTLTVLGDLANGNSGAVTITAQTAYVTGTLSNFGSLTLNNDPSFSNVGFLSVTGDFVNSGYVTIGVATLAIGGALANTGSITLDGGVVTAAGGMANAGTIDATNGVFSVAGPVSGNGTVDVGISATVDGSVASGQVFQFSNDNATLFLGNPGGFGGTIADLQTHDVIDIAAVADHTSYDAGTGLLTVFDGSAVVARFTVQDGQSLNAITDTHGGTYLTEEQIGTPAQVESYVTANTFLSALGDTPAGHSWPTPNPTVYFTLTGGWSSAETSAILQAMTMYHDVANITFAQAGPGHTAEIVWNRITSGGTADTAYDDVEGTTIASSATIQIDVTVPGWSSIDALGTTDEESVGGGASENFGGYGYLTALHELGHAIGFGHAGPYDDSGPGAPVDYLPSQIFFTDTRQYSVMSYLNANESGANWVFQGTTIYPQTPMLYDIGAAQLIYGANTSALTGHDTFGFNSDFGTEDSGAHQLAAYNFDENTVPVLTIYDGGPDNTLDLSGFATNDTVDLNAGHFSDVDGLTDNIAIAYDATIDTARGGAGNDTFVANTDADTIDGGTGTDTVVFAGNRSDYTISGNTAHATVTLHADGVVDTLTNIDRLVFADVSGDLPCFVQGTRILTARGEVPVQALRAGEDQVVTCEGRLAPVVWLGWRELDPSRHRRPEDVMPVRVCAHAFAPGRPARDLLLSPDHALAVNGALVPARYLVNGRTILREAWRGRLAYYHVELDRHDVLLAEGMPAESFLDSGNRDGFANSTGAVALHPRFAPDTAAALRLWAEHACAPLLLNGPALAEIRTDLLRRAVTVGHPLTEDPALRVEAAGRPLHLLRSGNRVRVHLPARAEEVRILSRIWTPLEMADASEDPRRLGIAVAGLRLSNRPLAPDDARLLRGWHAPEDGWRWTDGDAAVAPRGARVLEFRIAGVGRYWAEQPAAAPRRAAGAPLP